MSSSAVAHQHHLSALVALLANDRQCDQAPGERPIQVSSPDNMVSSVPTETHPALVDASGHLSCFTEPVSSEGPVGTLDANVQEVINEAASYIPGNFTLPPHVVVTGNPISHTSQPPSPARPYTAQTSTVTLQGFDYTSAGGGRRAEASSIAKSEPQWNRLHFESTALPLNPGLSPDSADFRVISSGQDAGPVPLVETFEVSNDPYSSPSCNILLEPTSSCTDAASRDGEDLSVPTFQSKLNPTYFQQHDTTATESMPSLVQLIPELDPEVHMSTDMFLKGQTDSLTRSSSSSSPHKMLGAMELSGLDMLMAGKRKIDHSVELTCESDPVRKRQCLGTYLENKTSLPFTSGRQLRSAHILQTEIDSAVASASTSRALQGSATEEVPKFSAATALTPVRELGAAQEHATYLPPTVEGQQFPASVAVSDPTSVMVSPPRHVSLRVPAHVEAPEPRPGSEMDPAAATRDQIRSELVSSTSEGRSANGQRRTRPCHPKRQNESLSMSTSSQRLRATTATSCDVPLPSQDAAWSTRPRTVPQTRKQKEETAQRGAARAPAGRAGVPSKFCHICTARTAGGAAAICAGVPLGTCRKTVCRSCFVRYEHNFQWEAVAGRGGHGWDCFHCRSKCPSAAQCKSYQRVNEKRRRRLLKMKLEACGAEGGQGGYEQQDAIERQSSVATGAFPAADTFDRATLVASQQRSLHFTSLMAQRLEARRAHSA